MTTELETRWAYDQPDDPNQPRRIATDAELALAQGLLRIPDNGELR